MMRVCVSVMSRPFLLRSGVGRALVLPTCIRRICQKTTVPKAVGANPEADPAIDIVQHITERGLLKEITDGSDLATELRDGLKTTIYCGADPTAKSLHIGNLVPLLGMLHFGIRGHDMIGLIGGATVEVGDPSGRTTERKEMESEVRVSNQDLITKQMHGVLVNAIEYARSKGYTTIGNLAFVNNAEWWKPMTFLQFMTMIGRHLRVQDMLRRQSVQSRITSESGIGFNEFSYQALQAYDFFHLYSTHGCRIQVGGSDQYGNIVCGVDLTQRLQHARGLEKKQIYGITTPLLTTAVGEKLGKSAGNAVWLDPNLTSPFELYQYFVRLADADVEKYLRILTLVPLPEIEAIVGEHNKDPSLRFGQHALANEVTDLVHGIGFGAKARVQSGILYSTPADGTEYSADEIIEAFKDDSHLIRLPRESVVYQRVPHVIKLLTNLSIKAGKSLLTSGGVYAGPKLIQLNLAHTFVDPDWLIDNKLLLFRLGKADMKIIVLE
ncbi:uncharacterized protein V1518DRAFT_411997 [Limtongia smithiae]|uniref:uncharacterized protein n=1 Tax=Limtongia smithiae TaxID=1125753 RepID=UPI0034CD3B6A